MPGPNIYNFISMLRQTVLCRKATFRNECIITVLHISLSDRKPHCYALKMQGDTSLLLQYSRAVVAATTAAVVAATVTAAVAGRIASNISLLYNVATPWLNCPSSRGCLLIRALVNALLRQLDCRSDPSSTC